MRSVYWILSILSLLLVSATLFLVFFANGNYYLRAMQLIYASPKDTRDQIKSGLFAGDNPNIYAGILAGVTGSRVWVWGRSGLRSFATDEHSIYFYKDICSEQARAEVVVEEGDEYAVSIDTALNQWRARLGRGDYVVVRIATVANGGILGNLREIHTYNYWPFVPGDRDTVCAK